jgi:hypothetical protein
MGNIQPNAWGRQCNVSLTASANWFVRQTHVCRLINQTAATSFWMQGMRVRPNGPQLISQLISKYLAIDKTAQFSCCCHSPYFRLSSPVAAIHSIFGC